MKNIFIDLDGVLTNGKMYIDHTGEKLFKSFCSRDVRAIRELIYHGYEVYIVSADDHPSGKHFASKVGAEFIYMRDKSKIGPSLYAIGDDVWDKEMLLKSQNPFCPSDCDPVIADIENITILNTRGGEGVIAEFLSYIMKQNKKLNDATIEGSLKPSSVVKS